MSVCLTRTRTPAVHVSVLSALVMAPAILAAADPPYPERQVRQELSSNGVYFTGSAVPDFATLESFTAYLMRHDPYADYLTSEQYREFRQALATPRAGLGIEIERDAAGVVRCYPVPGGAAAAAGVRVGDRLIAIGGRSIGTAGLPTIVAMAAEGDGAWSTLEIVDRTGRLRALHIQRERQRLAGVREVREGDRTALRIDTFTPGTRQQLEFLLTRRHSERGVVVDLRGNRGGDLNSAIDCAELFAVAGDVIVSVRGRDGLRQYSADFDGRLASLPLVIWQDEGTASAAEVFIAALTNNHRATSIGRPSFGKGTRQELHELKSGAALIFTTGYLLTPTGNDIDRHGLYPGVVLREGAATVDYWRETIAQPRSSRR